jgi:hypothetical protein
MYQREEFITKRDKSNKAPASYEICYETRDNDTNCRGVAKADEETRNSFKMFDVRHLYFSKTKVYENIYVVSKILSKLNLIL